MTYKVIRAKKEFFDRNPSGRILNRFSADIGTIDSALIACVNTCVDLGIKGLITLIIVSSISYYLIVVCVLIVIFYIKIGGNYSIPLSRIKQLESVTRSPVYSELS